MRKTFRSSCLQNSGSIKNRYRRLLIYSYGWKPSTVQMANGKANCLKTHWYVWKIHLCYKHLHENKPDFIIHLYILLLKIGFDCEQTTISQENTYLAMTIVKEILVNSCQKQHFNLTLLAKQKIPVHIIALEENYQEF